MMRATDQKIACTILGQGLSRYEKKVEQFPEMIGEVSPSQERPVQHGSWEVAVAIHGVVPENELGTLLDKLMSHNPKLTGRPVWMDSRGHHDEHSQPYVFKDAWEAFIHLDMPEGPASQLDFWRLEPSGFYFRQGLPDDLTHQDYRGPEPLTVLDYVLVIRRVGESLAVALAFARALGCDTDSTSLEFAFRWIRLKDRQLVSWADPVRYSLPDRISRQDRVVSEITLPTNTPASALGSAVHTVTRELFLLFDGTQISEEDVDTLTQSLLQKKL